MIINYNFINNKLIYEFICEKEFGDKKNYTNISNNREISLNQNHCYFIIPEILNNIHPDLIALSGILLIYPFVGKRVILNFSISKKFYDLFNRCNIELICNNEFCEERKINNSKSVPSISYSSGIDSTASLLFLPKSTIIIFMDRIAPIGDKSNYNRDNIYHTLDNFISIGYTTVLVKSDMEFIRKPIGFPTDIACGIPNILLADLYNIDSIAYGYCNHHAEFLENGKKIDYICTGDLQLKVNKKKKNNLNNYYFWKELFESVSLNLNFNTMGITEISTLILIDKSPLTGIISCMRGKTIGKQCMKCFKCFKAEAVRIVSNKKNLNNSDFEYLLNIIKEEIEKPRYNKNLNTIMDIKKIEAILLFITYFHIGNHPIANILRKYYEPYLKKFKNLNKFNEYALEFSYKKYKNIIINNMNQLDSIINNFNNHK